jgi:gliding motility-associated-like protein
VGNNVINIVVTAQNTTTTKTYIVTATRAAESMSAQYNNDPADILKKDDVFVHQAVSPNGDGDNDVLIIDGIIAYPSNSLTIMARSGALVFEAKSYNNSSVVFDGHSDKTGKLQPAGTYFYKLNYKDGPESKTKTGFILLKY